MAATLVAALLPCAAWAADVQALLERADAVRSSDPAQFESLLTKLESAKTQATPAQREHIRLLRVYFTAVRGQLGDAAEQSAALFGAARDPQIRFRAGMLAANTAVIARDIPVALRHLDQALAQMDAVADPHIREDGRIVAATVYNLAGRYREGLDHARGVAASALSEKSLCVARHLEVEALLNLKQPASDAHVQRAIRHCQKQGDLIATGLLRRDLATRWAGEGRTADALALLERHWGDFEATGYPTLIALTHAMIADYRLQHGDVAGARAQAERAHAMQQVEPHSLPIITAHRVLYEVAKRRGDLATALVEHEHYAAADKARLDEIKAREVAIQLGRLELTAKNQAIALLNERNQVLQLQQQVARTDMWNARLGIALLAVFALALAAWGWRGRQLQARLRALAQVDPLTGVANRRHFRERADALLARTAQRGRPVSLVMFDLDHFKRVNDCFGHAAGDRLLVEVARAVQRHCRPGDVLGRLGGEEFAVLLADCDLERARAIGQAMRDAIAAIDTRAIGCPLPISASFGCASSTLSGPGFEVLATHADTAMYRAKAGGRNRVAVHRGAADETGMAAAPTMPPPAVPVPIAAAPARSRLQRTV